MPHRKYQSGKYYLYLIFVLFFSACSSNIGAPVSSREQASTPPGKVITRYKSPPPSKKPTRDFHTVIKGDTLYSIAWNYGFDYKELARWNNIRDPFVIYPNQKLRLSAPTETKIIVKKPQQQPVSPEQNIVIHKETGETGIKPTKKMQPVKATDPLIWIWPTEGKIVKYNTPIAKKGIDIAGKVGQQINAAGNGRVVYSGSGLLGYGKLIIIKHNDTYLSAYAHNSKLLVNEGESIVSGQQIARMGQTTDGHAILHFEIRKNGKPDNPLDYLPNK